MEGIPGAPPLHPEDDAPSPPPPTSGTDPAGIDRFWLERAVELGRRGWGRVHPNPLVGCVLVRDGDMVGEG